MNDKPLTDREKQFTVLPEEADPKNALAKANQAVIKALAEIKKTKHPH
ncbi:hypothetical protein GNX18_16410 [Microbulbifer sp. SH-1]|nr:hypothetical protein [Microbulbifer sp. SH-1]QIL91183.1 hypothetical protein GNX18_16410 [Microbulbifer sp. SH-1]